MKIKIGESGECHEIFRGLALLRRLLSSLQIPLMFDEPAELSDLARGETARPITKFAAKLSWPCITGISL